MQILTWKETLKTFLVEDRKLSFLGEGLGVGLGVDVGVIKFCGSDDRVETIQEKKWIGTEYFMFLKQWNLKKVKSNFNKSHRQYPQDSQLRHDYLKPSCKLNVITLQMIGQFPSLLREFSSGAKTRSKCTNLLILPNHWIIKQLTGNKLFSSEKSGFWIRMLNRLLWRTIQILLFFSIETVANKIFDLNSNK